MKIPKSIKIAGHTVKVSLIKKIFSDEGIEQMGYAYLLEDRIEVATKTKGISVSESNIAQIFLHEIIHQVSDKYEINITEKQVALLASGLFQVIRDNKINFSGDK